MGLHVTPQGTFYVQRSLRTGEIVQVLPVRRPDMPSQLPSVGSLGITENFIESRRATLAADTARASSSQGRLQQELATAGGESLLATGKAALAQTPDTQAGCARNHGSNPQDARLPHDHRGDVRMTGELAMARPTGAQPAPLPPGSRKSSSPSDARCGSDTGRALRQDPQDPHQLPSATAVAPHMIPVRSWPDAHHKRTVNLPSFRAIDATAALTHEEQVRYGEQNGSSRGRRTRRRSGASPRSTSRHRSSRSNSMSSTGCSHSSTVSYRTKGSVSSADSANEANTPAVFSPGPDLYCSDSSITHSPAPTPAYETSFTGRFGHGYGVVTAGAGLPDLPRAASSHPSGIPNPPRASCLDETFRPPQAPPLQTSAQPNKKKTVWIIRTLEPRKMPLGCTFSGDGNDGFEPQRVQTFVETHTVL
ncbi:hypothetical protein SEPCBS119000_005666 [Sporothrix epigloea]|uniref:Uncharacterized protein n=1 Tax=Sporothrix epigloea TaxID=1892477 RepID=A0ABP0DZ59_9PEZI